MTPLDQEIDGGLGWFRGVVPAAGTTLGTTQEPPPEPPRKQFQNQLAPGVVPRLGPTLDLSRHGIRLAEDARNWWKKAPRSHARSPGGFVCGPDRWASLGDGARTGSP